MLTTYMFQAQVLLPLWNFVSSSLNYSSLSKKDRKKDTVLIFAYSEKKLNFGKNMSVRYNGSFEPF